MIDVARRDAPWVWGYFPTQFALHHAWYRNSKPNLMANNALKYRRIDPVLREQRQAEWNRPVVWPITALLVLVLLAVLPAFVAYRRQQRSVAYGDGQ
jgi:hypothetical protein